jgi:hypothetical protein
MIGYPNSEHYISSVDSIGRERRIYPIEPSLENIYGLPKRKWPARWYTRGYATALAYELRSLLMGSRWTLETLGVTEWPVDSNPIDKRHDPVRDAVLLFLSLTGVWRNSGIREVAAPVLCRCASALKSTSDHLDNCMAGDGKIWPEDLTHYIRRAKLALAVNRRNLGRPPSQSKWDCDEAIRILRPYIKFHYRL